LNTSTFLVAVIDDDPSILKGLSSLLRSEGYSVETFGDAEAFLKSAAAGQASFVVTDIQMPQVDGLELQDMMRRKRPELPIVIMTAFDDAATRSRAISGGARDVLVKPFPAEALLCQVKLVAKARTR
jgi:FixJ family two-component response regulator